jgi:hypothetical protein
MEPRFDQITELLAQRGEMRQEEGYWQDFLVEFHHNQHVASVEMSAPSAFLGGLRSWFSEVSPSKWAYGAGLVYATAAIAFFLAPRSPEINLLPPTPVNHQVVPAPQMQQMQQMEQPDTSPPSQGNAGEQAF